MRTRTIFEAMFVRQPGNNSRMNPMGAKLFSHFLACGERTVAEDLQITRKRSAKVMCA